MDRPVMTVTAERGRKRWILQCVEFPGAISEVTHLAQAEAAIREAIAWVATMSADAFDVRVVPQVDESVRRHLEHAAELRETADRALADARAESRAAARELAAADIPLRDVGRVLGVSHQRVHQLIHS